jgi:hypothetical protein
MNINKETEQTVKEGQTWFSKELHKQVNSFINSSRDFLNRELENVSEAVRVSSDKLKEKDSRFSTVFDKVSLSLDSVNKFVKNENSDTVTSQFKKFAYHNPGLTLGTMFIIGLAAGRLMKPEFTKTDNQV